MQLTFKTFLAALFLSASAPGLAHAQSNMDYFFKSTDQYDDVVVDEVITANTIVLKGKTGDKGEVIKLIGLRAPESPKRRTSDIKRDEFGFVLQEPVTLESPLEEKALEFVQNILVGRHVRLEFDDEKSDEDFRTLAYVFLKDDGTLINAEILRKGFADLQIRPPNLKYVNELRNAYKEARNEKRGLQGQ